MRHFRNGYKTNKLGSTRCNFHVCNDQATQEDRFRLQRYKNSRLSSFSNISFILFSTCALQPSYLPCSFSLKPHFERLDPSWHTCMTWWYNAIPFVVLARLGKTTNDIVVRPNGVNGRFNLSFSWYYFCRSCSVRPDGTSRLLIEIWPKGERSWERALMIPHHVAGILTCRHIDISFLSTLLRRLYNTDRWSSFSPYVFFFCFHLITVSNSRYWMRRLVTSPLAFPRYISGWADGYVVSLPICLFKLFIPR